MIKYTVFIPCIPPTTTAQQHKRIFRSASGKSFLATDRKGAAVQTELCALLALHAPPSDFPRTLPLSCSIRLFFPYRKSEKKSVLKSNAHVAHTSRPDADNLVKFLLDCMTRTNFWNDDAQVFQLLIEKYWHGTPGIQIALVAHESPVLKDRPNVFS